MEIKKTVKAILTYTYHIANEYDDIAFSTDNINYSIFEKKIEIFNVNGKLIRSILYDKNKVVREKNYNKYDNSGNLIETIYSKNYEKAEKKILFKYSENGNIEETIIYGYNNTLNFTEYHHYESRFPKKLSETKRFNSKGILNSIFTYKYDNNGNEVQSEFILFPLNNGYLKTLNNYNSKGLLVKSTNYINDYITHKYLKYNASDKIVEEKEISVDGSVNKVVEYFYDSSNILFKKTEFISKECSNEFIFDKIPTDNFNTYNYNYDVRSNLVKIHFLKSENGFRKSHLDEEEIQIFEYDNFNNWIKFSRRSYNKLTEIVDRMIKYY